MITLPNQQAAAFLRQAFDASDFARISLGFNPDDTQQRILSALPKRLILNCNRQWGKSTIAAILLAHRAAFVAGSLCIRPASKPAPAASIAIRSSCPATSPASSHSLPAKAKSAGKCTPDPSLDPVELASQTIVTDLVLNIDVDMSRERNQVQTWLDQLH